MHPSDQDQSETDRDCDGLCAVDHIEALHRLIAMEVHGALAQAEDCRDLEGGFAPADPCQHFTLAVGEVEVTRQPRAAMMVAQAVLNYDPQHLEIDRLR